MLGGGCVYKRLKSLFGGGGRDGAGRQRRAERKKLNFRFLARAKTWYGISQPSNYTAAGGLEEVGQGTRGFVGIWLSEVRGRFQAEASEGALHPLSRVGKSVQPGLDPQKQTLTAKTHSGGYKTGPQAKNKHFSRIDNSVPGGGWGKTGGVRAAGRSQEVRSG